LREGGAYLAESENTPDDDEVLPQGS